MTDRLALLYPAAAQEVAVALSVPAPRFPNPPRNERNLGSARDFYGPAILKEVRVDGGDSIAFIEKAFPHSRYDVMMLVSDDTVKTAVTEVAEPSKAMMTEVTEQFVTYLSDENVMAEFGLADGHFHVSYNYDRDTVDRENSMYYDKRFHLHLNYWPGRDLRGLSATTWGSCGDTALRRRLIDPVAHLAALIVHDITGGSVAGHKLLPPDPDRDVAQGLPFGPKLALPGWLSLRTSQLPAVFAGCHRAAETAYREIRSCLTGETDDPGPWRRPSLLSRSEIAARLRSVEWLSPATLAMLMQLAELLENVPPPTMERFRGEESSRVRSLSLSGLDYAVSLFSQHRNTPKHSLARHETVFLVLQAKLFADIGGAGLPTIDRIALARIDRSAGQVMSEAEIADRAQLRTQFLDRIWPGLEAAYKLEIRHG